MTRPLEKPEKQQPMGWARALVIMVALAAVLYVVEIVDVATGRGMDRYGLRPRTIDGLEGIVTAPFLHDTWWHLVTNTLPFVLIGWVVLLGGVRSFVIATGLVLLIGGLLTWLAAPSGDITGVSGLIFGWLGYLFGRAFFTRRLMWILAAIGVAIIFGGMLGGLLPAIGRENSWQAHLCSFGGGLVTAWLMHPRRARRPKTARPAPVS